MPKVTLELHDPEMSVAHVLVGAKLVPSTSEGRRRIKGGAVQIDGEKVTDIKASLKKGGPYVVRAGKRAYAEVTLA